MHLFLSIFFFFCISFFTWLFWCLGELKVTMCHNMGPTNGTEKMHRNTTNFELKLKSVPRVGQGDWAKHLLGMDAASGTRCSRSGMFGLEGSLEKLAEEEKEACTKSIPTTRWREAAEKSGQEPFKASKKNENEKTVGVSRTNAIFLLLAYQPHSKLFCFVFKTWK